MAKMKEMKGKVEYYTRSSKWEEQGIVQLANYIIGLNLSSKGYINFFKQDLRFTQTGDRPTIVNIEYNIGAPIIINIEWDDKFKSFGTSIKRPASCSPSTSGRKVLYAKTYQGILKRFQNCLQVATRKAEEEVTQIKSIEEQKKRRDEIGAKKIALLGDTPLQEVDYYDLNQKRYAFNQENQNSILLSIDTKNETDTYQITLRGNYTAEETKQLLNLLRNSREYIIQILTTGDQKQK